MSFFFFFFHNLESILTINQAFSNICLNKILHDGYIDLSRYIFEKSSKAEMTYRLALDKSKFIKLFQTDYPNKEYAYKIWCQLFPEELEKSDIIVPKNLTATESEAIVYWVYMTMNTPEERIEFTRTLFGNIKDLHHINNHIKHQYGVFYNSEKIELEIISSISKFNDYISKYRKDDALLFYRGHADANFCLQPSISRNDKWQKNERAMYNALLINCPDDFEKCHSHLEKLVEMQHYGLPTRLLDITQNPLVALYFACESKFDCYGEVILIPANKDQVKYPQGDTASILASLASFDYEVQQEFYKLAIDNSISQEEFNNNVPRLLHEIRLEKPAFHPDIVKQNLIENIIVLTLKNNRRIVKQDGAFILCGLSNNNIESLNKFRLKKKNKTVVILVKNKEQILKQLSNFSINHATLFPEIDCVAEHIKKIYS